MTPEEIRLECVKLAFRHDHAAEQIIAKAAMLVAFVITPSSDAPASATRAEESKGRKGRGPQTESA